MQAEINKLREENEKLKEQLKKYTAPARRKKYYDNHKEELLKKSKEYNAEHKPAKEKKSEYNRKHYLKKKEMDDSGKNNAD